MKYLVMLMFFAFHTNLTLAQSSSPRDSIYKNSYLYKVKLKSFQVADDQDTFGDGELSVLLVIKSRNATRTFGMLPYPYDYVSASSCEKIDCKDNSYYDIPPVALNKNIFRSSLVIYDSDALLDREIAYQFNVSYDLTQLKWVNGEAELNIYNGQNKATLTFSRKLVVNGP